MHALLCYFQVYILFSRFDYMLSLHVGTFSTCRCVVSGMSKLATKVNVPTWSIFSWTRSSDIDRMGVRYATWLHGTHCGHTPCSAGNFSRAVNIANRYFWRVVCKYDAWRKNINCCFWSVLHVVVDILASTFDHWHNRSEFKSLTIPCVVVLCMCMQIQCLHQVREQSVHISFTHIANICGFWNPIHVS